MSDRMGASATLVVQQRGDVAHIPYSVLSASENVLPPAHEAADEQPPARRYMQTQNGTAELHKYSAAKTV